MQITANESTNKRRPLYWIIAIVIIGLLIAGGIFLIQSRNDQAQAGDIQTGDTVDAFVGDLSASVTASGQVEAVQSAILSVAQPGTVEAVLVTAGTSVETGDPLVQLAQRDLALQVERMEQNVTLKEAELQALLEGASASDMAAAEAAVQSAQASLDDLLAGPTDEEIAEYEANIRQQQAGVWSASASYNSTAGSISASSLATAESELVSAQIAYDKAKERNEDFAISFTHDALVDAQDDLAIAQAKVDELRAGPKQGSLNSASADISAAQANLNQKLADYDALLTGPTAAQISAAESNLATTLSDQAGLKSGASIQEIAIAEAELEQARLDLLASEESLVDTTIVAPFDGLVTDVLVSFGERATGSVIELVSSDLEAVLQVDELDIGSLSIGQPAVISFETWPDSELKGRIGSIAPSSGSNDDNVVNYDVLIAFDSTDLPILVGMTVDAQLVTNDKEGVLLIPNAAVTADRQADTYSVTLVVGEENGEPLVENTEVTIGLRDNEYTEILSGISEGDTVLIGELVAPTIDFGSGPGFDGD